MKNIENLTIAETTVPAGRSMTEDELDRDEFALFHLLYSYREHKLKPELCLTLHKMNELQKRNGFDFFYVDDDLMKPAELYKLIDSATVLIKYLNGKINDRLEKRAAAGDQHAIEDLRSLG